jgi:hypothetical protein
MSMHALAAVTLLFAIQPPAAPPPDCKAAEHRQFDFWVGDWDVVPNGKPAAPGQKPSRNTIVKSHGGCVLVENWDAGTQTGQSFNIYDRSRGQWHQTWVDSNGGLHDYWGERVGPNRVFFGTTPVPGRPLLRMRVRLTFFDLGDGKVRQLSERLESGGWAVNYDLLYTRRPVAPPK